MQFLFSPDYRQPGGPVRAPARLTGCDGCDGGRLRCSLTLAPNLALLVIGRLIAGIAGATYAPAMAYIADVSAPQDRAKNFGPVGAVFGVGFVLGPAIGGLVGEIGTFVHRSLLLRLWLRQIAPSGFFLCPNRWSTVAVSLNGKELIHSAR